MFRKTNAGRSSLSAHISVSGIRIRARNGTMTAQYIRLVSTCPVCALRTVMEWGSTPMIVPRMTLRLRKEA